MYCFPFSHYTNTQPCNLLHPRSKQNSQYPVGLILYFTNSVGYLRPYHHNNGYSTAVVSVMCVIRVVLIQPMLDLFPVNVSARKCTFFFSTDKFLTINSVARTIANKS